ncbi:MAG: FMN-binding negative transcriptional regulator [Bacteroidetes bacterium]|nr:MAG: FMN-binding negative transcriptional regulator [Bacteroidota bacterium]
MYVPKLYQVQQQAEKIRMMREAPFGILLSCFEGEYLATHLPLEVVEMEGKVYLQGHVARANPQWKVLEQLEEVLLIFSGPHSYVSSSWYTHLNVPTWNYTAVHAYGRARLLPEAESYELLKRTVAHYESGQESPLLWDEAFDRMVRKQMRGIVAFEVAVSRLEGKRKLSQNRNEEDYRRVMEKLRHSPDPGARAVAAEMERERS